jgi:hypothetical protein
MIDIDWPCFQNKQTNKQTNEKLALIIILLKVNPPHKIKEIFYKSKKLPITTSTTAGFQNKK